MQFKRLSQKKFQDKVSLSEKEEIEFEVLYELRGEIMSRIEEVSTAI